MHTKDFPVVTAAIITLNAVIFTLAMLSGEQIQIIQGAIVASSAYNYIQKLEGKPTIRTDWNLTKSKYGLGYW